MKNPTYCYPLLLLAMALTVVPVWAQDDDSATDDSPAKNESSEQSETNPIEEVVVEGHFQRLPADLSAFPGSVTVVGFEELQVQRAMVDDLGVILGNQIPGFSPSGSQTSASNFDQTLRGRKPAVFIDGVPITTPMRDGAQDIRSLHPAVIESIQVIRGSTTLYGNGGAGGVINYITRTPTEGQISYQTEVSTGASLTHVGDSMPFGLNQYINGDTGVFDFLLNGSINVTQSAFDANGDRIPPNPNVQIGLADSVIYNLFGKMGFEQGNHRFELSGLFYEQRQDTDYELVNGDVSEGIPTSTKPADFHPDRVDPGNENIVINAVYTHADVLGGTARVQAFYQDYESMFEWFPDPVFPDNGQPYVIAEKWGSRVDMTTPLNNTPLGGGSISWGLDFWQDETGQPLQDGRTYVPELKQTTLAPFIQAELPLMDRLSVMGGLRYEDIDVDVPDYTALFSGAEVTGGTIKYSETTYNVGFVANLFEGVDLFASISQGVSVAELGRILRQTTVDIDIDTINLEPSVTDSYEIGFRGSLNTFSYSAVAFKNESDLGTNVSQVPGTEQFIVLLQPEEIKGYEFTLDYTPTETLRLGGSYSKLEGKTDSTNDGSFDSYLTGQRIPPSKFTAYVETEIRDGWSLRVQGTYTGERNKFPGSTAFGKGEVNSHLILDAYTKFSVGAGDLSVAISNLLNEDYYTHTSEISNTDNRYSKAPGIMASIKYSISY